MSAFGVVKADGTRDDWLDDRGYEVWANGVLRIFDRRHGLEGNDIHLYAPGWWREVVQ